MTLTPTRPQSEDATAKGETEWLHCAGCNVMLYRKRLARNLHVCPECGHHGRLSARERIAQLTDPNTFEELSHDAVAIDPLGFVDTRPYQRRLQEAVERTGEREAAVFGTASVDGVPVVLLVMDFRFLGGSMGAALGEAVTCAAETAISLRIPLVLTCASGGARMQEGVISLLQMAKTSQAMAMLHEAGLLSICILTDPTFGGVTASYATLGSIVLVESGALVGFAGPRVISQTIRATLPPGFQTADFLLEHGLVDRVESRAALRSVVARLLRLHQGDLKAFTPEVPDYPTATDAAPLPHSADKAWEVVRLARDIGRPTTIDYLQHAFEDFVELHGDRCFADDPAVVGGVARIGGRAVVVVGHQKGHDTRELVARNFGMPHPEGYRKALRLFEHAERLGMPVVTLVDTPGAYPGIEAEERGQAIAVAELIARSSRLRVPIVSVITGEGGSGGALALATGDRLLTLANSFYSVISPEGCAAILWRTPSAAADAARALHLSSRDLKSLGVADAIVPEPIGGAQSDHVAAASLLCCAVTAALEELRGVTPAALLAARQARFRSVGIPSGTYAAGFSAEPVLSGVRAHD
jgi:acyl-CoA carboxylase subunit beta